MMKVLGNFFEMMVCGGIVVSNHLSIIFIN